MKSLILSLCLTIPVALIAQINQVFITTQLEEVCPEIDGSGAPSYTFGAFATNPGCFAWSVFEDGQ